MHGGWYASGLSAMGASSGLQGGFSSSGLGGGVVPHSQSYHLMVSGFCIFPFCFSAIFHFHRISFINLSIYHPPRTDLHFSLLFFSLPAFSLTGCIVGTWLRVMEWQQFLQCKQFRIKMSRSIRLWHEIDFTFFKSFFLWNMEFNHIVINTSTVSSIPVIIIIIIFPSDA